MHHSIRAIPGYFRLMGTDTFLRIGGYFKTDFIYDLKPAAILKSFIPSTFPIPAPPGVNNTTVSIRPTRMNLDFLVPVKSSSVRFFIEFDLFGTNATTPRLRHAYAQANNFLLGQSFSNFMDPDSGPDTLDFQGPNSQVSIRNPQLRYTIPLKEKSSLSFSVEKASSDVAFKTPTFNSLPNSPTPDFSVKYRDEFTRGHVQLSGLFRDVAAYLPDGRSDSVFGWGVNLTGAMKVVGSDVFVYQAAYGTGMERYVNDTSGLGTDELPRMQIIRTCTPCRSPRSTAGISTTGSSSCVRQPSSALHKNRIPISNRITPTIRAITRPPTSFGIPSDHSLNIGTEFLYGWLVEKDKSSANAPHFMFSAKYNFIKASSAK